MKKQAHILATALLALCSLGYGPTVLAQTDYSNALSQASYQVFSADINGDGRADLLLKASMALIPVLQDDDSVVAVPAPALAKTFVLLSSASGSYTLDQLPADATVNSSAWQPSAATLSFGYLQGNGYSSMLIRGAGAGAPSFTIAVDASGTLSLLQQLSQASVGVDLGAPGVTVELKDSNGDGRADLVVRNNGRVSAVLLADASGLFHKDDASSISAVWNGMLQELANANSTGAAAYFSPESQDSYQSMFNALGTDIRSVGATFSNFRFVSMTPEVATAVITRNYNGQTTMHFITFVADGNGWNIREF